VTLGGTGKERGKRHPTILNGVVIGAGAQVLGNITVGENCRVGAASVVIDDVPDNSTIVGVPGHIIFRNGKRVVITNPREIRDPLSDALTEVAQRVEQLEEKVKDVAVHADGVRNS
jgi:serine O-acetyltransferase